MFKKWEKRYPKLMRLIRTVFIVFFMLFFIAAGHLAMVLVNAIDARVSKEFYQKHQGPVGRWFGDRSILNVLKHLRDTKSKEERKIWQAAIEKAKKNQFTFRMLPNSKFLVFISLFFSLLALLLLVYSKRLTSDTAQTLVGLFAGQFIWIGGVEYGLMMASRSLGVAKNFMVFNGQVVGIAGEYVLMKYTWGLVLVVMVYLLFMESSRCPFFLWFRRKFSLMKGAIATGRIDNYAPRIAFQYSSILWTFYVYLLLAYDESIFGVYSWFTYVSFFIFLAFSGYLLLKLYRKPSIGSALRYSIGTVIIVWNLIEITAKWRLFQEPWLILHPWTLTFFLGGVALGTWLVIMELRRKPEEEEEG